MNSLEYLKDYREAAGSRPDRFYKSTLFQSSRMLLGLNCLEPGQTQPSHTHEDQDKFYYVIEGEGLFLVGEESQTAGPGMIVWAPSGIEHGVTNNGSVRLTLLVGIAPAPA